MRSESASVRSPRDLFRFWVKVDKSAGMKDCWLWTASLEVSGYGQFAFKRRVVKAHRFAYEVMIGPIPIGLVLDHSCRVRRCVNPAHLEPVSLAENSRRGGGNRKPHRGKTHCVWGHPYTPENTYQHAREKECRVCRARRAETYKGGEACKAQRQRRNTARRQARLNSTSASASSD